MADHFPMSPSRMIPLLPMFVINISDKCPPGKYFEVENGMIVCKECPIGKYSDEEMQEKCTECPDKKTTQATGTKSADMCICKLTVKILL